MATTRTTKRETTTQTTEATPEVAEATPAGVVKETSSEAAEATPTTVPKKTSKEIPVEDTPEELDLSYEQARDELIQVVNRLESGTESLAESMELFKRGEALASLCERLLTQARTVVENRKED